MSAAKPRVSFHDPKEFLDELRIDRDDIDRRILRSTVRRRYQPPFVAVSVVASVIVGERVVVPEYRLGEVFSGDEGRAEMEEEIQTALDSIGEAAKSLGLEVRAGVIERPIPAAGRRADRTPPEGRDALPAGEGR